jgi:ankyrin repeat protein
MYSWLSSPIHLAAGRGHAAVVKALLSASASIHSLDGYDIHYKIQILFSLCLKRARRLQQTPLHSAVLSAHTDTVRLLLGWNHSGKQASCSSIARIDAEDK